MAYGAGKYDTLCTEVREKTSAKGAIVIILDGNLGSGFSMQADPETTATLPTLLENIAKQIRASGN